MTGKGHFFPSPSGEGRKGGVCHAGAQRPFMAFNLPKVAGSLRSPPTPSPSLEREGL